jgi:hypothetical protein
MARPKQAPLRSYRRNPLALSCLSGRPYLGKLVPFQKPVRPAKGKPVIGQGEIVLFTGVRYQRDTVSPGKPPATARPKRKRG